MMTLPVRMNEGRSEFDVSTLPTGAYVVMLTTNGTVITHRLMVRH
jgi:phosphosulfolactate phosphohydrolase-like enzyme